MHDTASTSSSRSRTPIQNRLQSLLVESPRSSLDAGAEQSEDSDTWPSNPGAVAVASVASPPSSSLAGERVTRSAKPDSAPDLFEAASQLPIVRWFRGESSSLPTSPRSESPTSPSSALREAIDDELPVHARHSIDSLPSNFQLQRPPKALLSGHNMNSIGRNGLRRTPPFLDSLTRATLPTASVTEPLPVHRQQTSYFLPTPADIVPRKYDNDIHSPAIDISHSPPSVTSIESLRQIRNQDRPSTSSQNRGHDRSFSTGAGPSRWWFGTRKSEVDELLDDSDKAPTIEGEEARIRAKCKCTQALRSIAC